MMLEEDVYSDQLGSWTDQIMCNAMIVMCAIKLYDSTIPILNYHYLCMM